MFTKAKDISLILEDRPGMLYKVTEALGKAGVNIDGFSGASECDNTFHFLFVKDADKALRTIEAEGWKVKQERDVALVDVADRPGTAAAELKKISQQELDVDLLYVATNNRLVIGGQEFPRIWEALSGETQKIAR